MLPHFGHVQAQLVHWREDMLARGLLAPSVILLVGRDRRRPIRVANVKWYVRSARDSRDRGERIHGIGHRFRDGDLGARVPCLWRSHRARVVALVWIEPAGLFRLVGHVLGSVGSPSSRWVRSRPA